jgi:hypothetical protein
VDDSGGFGRVGTPLLHPQPGLDSGDAITAAGSITPFGCFGTAGKAAASALYDGVSVC